MYVYYNWSYNDMHVHDGILYHMVSSCGTFSTQLPHFAIRSYDVFTAANRGHFVCFQFTCSNTTTIDTSMRFHFSTVGVIISRCI